MPALVESVAPCRSCGLNLPLRKFHRSGNGVQTICIDCAKTIRMSQGFRCVAEGCSRLVSNKAYCCKRHTLVFFRRPHPRRYVDGHGYVLLYVPDHPNARPRGYVSEHLVVMSTYLGRRIETENGEEIHHKNGVRSDNRLENLELWVSAQPSGQRPSDLIEWCQEILERYATGQDAAWLEALLRKVSNLD